MAVRSIYDFYSYEDFKNARTGILGECPAADDHLEWISRYDEYFYVKIYDSISQCELECVVRHIREHNGHYSGKSEEIGGQVICPNCGNEVPSKELFCEKCGMRINKEFAKLSQVEPVLKKDASKDARFHNFTEWSKYWAELFVKNYEFWAYLVHEHINDPDFELPLLVCANQFSTVKDMNTAYNYLVENEKNLGYGLPSYTVIPVEDERRWYVFLDCCDLPFVLLIAEYFGGPLCGWADYFIPQPPLPISIDKNISAYKGNFAPVKTKREVVKLKKIAQRYQHSNLLKPILDLKANLRSIYIFLKERDYTDFKNKVWYENRDIYNKLDWYGDSSAYGYDKCWVVKLYDDLNSVELEWTVDRIREFHGQYYQN